MRWRRGTLGLVAALALGACALAPAAASAGLTTFVAKRPGLKIRIAVLRHQIRYTETGASVVCKGTGPAAGDVNLGAWGTFGFGISRSGRFQKEEVKTYVASGTYFWRLEGKVRPNRIVGRYTAWEEPLDGNEPQPRCGTRSPQGLPIRFVAHRVSGPPWRP